MSLFERYLTLWVALCIGAGILLGRIAPGIAESLDALAITVNGAPVVSIPIALCLFFMMYPIMVKIDFHEVVKAGKAWRPVGLTLFINWGIKPFTMYAISSFFLGTLFLAFIGPDAVDHVKLPLGEGLAVGDRYGAGQVVLVDGVRVLEVPLWRSYLAGCILLGIAPCTAMVLVWGYLSKGNDGHTLVMVAINSLTMLVLFGVLGGFLLGVGQLPVPWEALLLSIGAYVALPLVAGFLSRKWIIAAKGEVWFRESFLRYLTPVTITALLITLVVLFLSQGRDHLGEPAHHSVDRDSADGADDRHLRAGLCGSPLPRTQLRECGAHRHDRRLQSLRGGHRHRGHALRPVFGCGAGDGGGRAHRSAADAGARALLPPHSGLVSEQLRLFCSELRIAPLRQTPAPRCNRPRPPACGRGGR